MLAEQSITTRAAGRRECPCQQHQFPPLRSRCAVLNFKESASVRSRQEQLEADVASAWKLDPNLNDKNLGTNQVHFAKGRIN